jgi:hypothetical protein
MKLKQDRGLGLGQVTKKKITRKMNVYKLHMSNFLMSVLIMVNNNYSKLLGEIQGLSKKGGLSFLYARTKP